MSKGEFTVVEYTFWEKTYTEILEPEKIRPKVTNSHVDKNTFCKIEIEVPDDLRE